MPADRVVEDLDGVEHGEPRIGPDGPARRIDSRSTPGCDQRTSYRATVLPVLAALDRVARANERTYQEPAVPNFQVNLARPFASAVTLTRL